MNMDHQRYTQHCEAFLVHLIDMMDSKMSSLTQVKKTDSSSGTGVALLNILIVLFIKIPCLPFQNTKAMI